MARLPRKGLTAHVESIERDLITKALRRSGGSRKVAAELLRIKRTTLVMKLRRYGIDTGQAS